ncbi:hypothetical protein RFI_30948 [Reticulomyxa filosa]|uniref:YbaK/aminoacyl-tRNA synthetase-associated domain-containing protein n=1 Tax=Reticulomyxa filosa TaxID=46433 RepID=X6LXX4_RETFI|nr:hypothetical protein RFI_30948 [Reticulomyxa filosa]|eukprot:ETO06449.1 hypothetical protein RFI_30948 [Reticulomyxa filosa]
MASAENNAIVSDQLSKSAQSVQDVLSAKGLKVDVKELSESTRTAEEAAKTLGCEVAQIAKSLIFQTNSNRPILVIASGANRVNEKTLAKLVKEKIKRATPEFCREATGFAIGGIPPVGHKQNIDTYIDEDLLQHEKIWAAAGTPNAVFCLNSKNIQDLTGGKVISIK